MSDGVKNMARLAEDAFKSTRIVQTVDRESDSHRSYIEVDGAGGAFRATALCYHIKENPVVAEAYAFHPNVALFRLALKLVTMTGDLQDDCGNSTVWLDDGDEMTAFKVLCALQGYLAIVVPEAAAEIRTARAEAEYQKRLEEAAPEMLRLLEILTSYAERSVRRDPGVYNDDDLSDKYEAVIRDAERVIKTARGGAAMPETYYKVIGGNNNSGSENIGHDNSGGDNQGSRNAGSHNDGYHNVGDWNRANFHVGHFNTEDPSTMLTFNRPCRVSDWNLARKPLFLSRLKKNSSSEDRQKEYDQAPYADKQLLADLPNFDPGIFREITGIRVDRTIGPTIPRDTTVPTREVAGAVPVKIKLVHPDAKVPERATDGSAGYDLVATTAIKNPAGTCVYGTGVAVEIPPDHVGLLFPRSSIAWTGMMVANSVGVIDSDYRGEISAVMHRVRDGVKPPYKEGDRIGQLVIVESPRVKFIQVEELSETTRGQGGYGSTGR